jgi:hypothetical protein
MRRVELVAFLSVCLSVFTPAFAQHTGASGSHGGGSFGGHFAGGSFGHASGSFAGGSFGRSPGFAPRSSSASRLASSAPGRAFVPGYRVPYTTPGAGLRGGGLVSPDRRHYRSPYRGYGYGGYPYAYGNSWELLPWDIGYPDFTGYGYDDYGTQAYGAGAYGDDSLQQSAPSVAAPDDGYRSDYAGPVNAYQDYAPPPPAEEETTASVAPEPALTLIFNDGHREDIHNYVLTANAVIVMDEAASGRQERIPLPSINVAATQQAAEQQGLDFTPPA